MQWCLDRGARMDTVYASGVSVLSFAARYMPVEAPCGLLAAGAWGRRKTVVVGLRRLEDEWIQ